MKNITITTLIIILILSTGIAPALQAKQGPRDTTFNNTNNSGIPNSGNTLYPNNGPEFPHSSPSNPSTDPGPLFHGPSGNTFDSIPDPQKGSHPQ